MAANRTVRIARGILGGLARVVPKRLRQDQAGTVAVEFGIVALPFFTMIFAIIQLALLFFSDQLLETAVADAARLIRTGQAKSAGWTITTFNTQVCSELYSLMDCTKLQSYVTAYSQPTSISTSPPTIDPATGKYTPATQTYDSNANSGSYLVLVSTYYQYPSLFSALGLSVADQSNGTRLIGAVAAFRNEPFP